MSTQPTAGVLSAARIIVERFDYIRARLTEKGPVHAEITTIINSETHAGEMEAIRHAAQEYIYASDGVRYFYSETEGQDICGSCGSLRKHGDHYDTCSLSITEAALRLALAKLDAPEEVKT